jgi:polysaccharide pyruvyl transferase WcaK-like protein
MRTLHSLAKYHEEAYRLGHFPSLASLLGKQKIYAYYGFLGDRNFGDELVYEAARHLFAPSILLPIKRRMPAELALFARANKQRFAGIVVGGGTLIGPSLYCFDFFEELLDMGKPVYMHGTGVKLRKTWTAAWEKLLKAKISGGVRGPQSIVNISAVKPDTKIVGDAAFALFDAEAANENGAERKTVLINLGTHDRFEGIDESRGAMETFVDSLCKAGTQVHFMPCYADDISLGRALQQRYPAVKMLHVPVTYNDAEKHFRSAAFAIGERLHFTAMAMLTGCPFLSVNYAPKHEDLLSSIDLSSAGAVPKHLTADAIQSAYESRRSFDRATAFRHIDDFKAIQRSELAVMQGATS